LTLFLHISTNIYKLKEPFFNKKGLFCQEVNIVEVLDNAFSKTPTIYICPLPSMSRELWYGFEDIPLKEKEATNELWIKLSSTHFDS